MKKHFIESPDTAVFTSKYVVAKSSPIVYIAHHGDGTWEFWGKEKINESEIMVVTLGQIISIDSSVLEVADLPVEFNAIRESKSKRWEIVSKN